MKQRWPLLLGICLALGFVSFLLRSGFVPTPENRAGIVQPTPVVDPPTGLMEATTSSTREHTALLEVTPQLAQASAAPPSLSVSVVDPQYRAIARAQLQLWDGTSLRVVGESNAEGRCDVLLPNADRIELIGSAEGYAETAIVLALPRTESLTFVLQPAGKIRGRVLRPDKSDAGPGIQVLAVPARERTLMGTRMERICRTNTPCAHRVFTAADGTFEFLQLVDGADYRLAASAKAESTTGLVGPVLAGPHATQDLTIRSLYELRVEFVDADTGLPISYFSSLQDAAFRMRVIGDVSPAMLFPGAECFWGLAPRRAESTGHMFIAQFTCDAGFALAGPVEIDVAIPGFEAWTGRVWFPRVDAPQAPERIALRSTASGFGDLIVELPKFWTPEFGARDLHLATLNLHGVHGPSLVLALHPSSSGRIEFAGLPQGEYLAIFGPRGAGGAYPMPNEPQVRVRISDKPAVFRIPGELYGSLELDLRRPDGSAYAEVLELILLEGPVNAASGQKVRTPARQQRFLSAPYRIDGLRPGAYTVHCKYPEVATPLANAEVVGAQRSLCRIMIP